MDNAARQVIFACMTQDTDIAIVGGGLNGPALALACARAGLTVTVIDALPAQARAEAGFDGRAYALALASQRMLRALGLWQTLADHAQPMQAIKVTDGRVGDAATFLGLSFASAERLMQHLGVTPGSVTALAIAGDTDGAVTFVLDRRIVDEGCLDRCQVLARSTAAAALTLT